MIGICFRIFTGGSKQFCTGERVFSISGICFRWTLHFGEAGSCFSLVLHMDVVFAV